ncbi:CDP-glycerol glycerophosphotransferase family protein [Salisediminibacterium halotolerans]|uniref:CDP-glycerol glycerophosphotransferase family protein n=1 Tax=Salisediminibacterium halotolerans TaxID=517425 RepID=UPI000F18BB00|nr:CDP-glycerol glycerophosphotransferase family protein [Salisediminibacterium halotolerans]RLJ75695.1 CDP-glycerol glycerophosphotransferase (TagB/SpsB family) [Actinophytocola xinjiangensis]RPE89549.1 CDP-glycerol glycerophosphotransferase (TagB/SpsB family) [Salisediminibacterium halotolerans]TWG36308.1 CDP-glycerol glycerophosphotransferase (TagB/SpsB family) [Salisediminibacterium halotolerans]GEL07244.1 glycerophosphotransferase [Salisediminibacterium halotolerans]
MFQKIVYLKNILIAIMILPFFKGKLKSNVILIGGHDGKQYTDNGKALFEYLYHYTDYDVRWVINKDYRYKQNIKNYITRGSIKNYLYYFSSIGLFFSHSGSDVGPIIHKYVKPKAIVINLEHGIFGLKKMKFNNERDKKKARIEDFFLCVSDFEKTIKAESLDVDRDKLIVTGLPRFDSLHSHISSSSSENVILFMPTWREWYYGLSEEEFIQTDFFQSVSDVLENEQIMAVLKKHNYKIYVYLHFYFHNYIDTLNIKNGFVEVLDIDEDVQKHLIQSDVLITDYSSVCWDFFYLDKPVIFYQFDQKRYEKERGAYINLDTDLIGPKAKDLDELITVLEDTITNRQAVVEQFKPQKNKYFAFHDNQNCKRVLDSFENQLNREEI